MRSVLRIEALLRAQLSRISCHNVWSLIRDWLIDIAPDMGLVRMIVDQALHRISSSGVSSRIVKASDSSVLGGLGPGSMSPLILQWNFTRMSLIPRAMKKANLRTRNFEHSDRTFRHHASMILYFGGKMAATPRLLNDSCEKPQTGLVGVPAEIAGRNTNTSSFTRFCGSLHVLLPKKPPRLPRRPNIQPENLKLA